VPDESKKRCVPDPEGTLLDALMTVHGVLEDAGVDHALCGGLAANLYRDEVRATNDVDLYLVVGAARLVELARTFESQGWRAHPAWRKAELLRLERARFPKVDCLIAATEYERGAVAGAVPANIAGRTVKVLTAEDLIVFKLVAGRARDYEAVAAIINSRGGTLDADYILRWLTSFDLHDRWRRALEEAERERE